MENPSSILNFDANSRFFQPVNPILPMPVCSAKLLTWFDTRCLSKEWIQALEVQQWRGPAQGWHVVPHQTHTIWLSTMSSGTKQMSNRVFYSILSGRISLNPINVPHSLDTSPVSAHAEFLPAYSVGKRPGRNTELWMYPVPMWMRHSCPRTFGAPVRKMNWAEHVSEARVKRYILVDRKARQ